MIDTINSLNTTTFTYKSIIVGGSGVAPIPDGTEALAISANTEIVKYLREKNPAQGIYFGLGPTDFIPPNYQSFASSGAQYLTDVDAAINFDTA